MTDIYNFSEYSSMVQLWVQEILENRGLSPEETLKACENLILHGKKTEDKRLLGFGYFFRAENYYILNQVDEFLRSMMTALPYLDASKQWDLMARSYNLMAIHSLSRGNAPFAMDYYLTSLKYCTAHELTEMGTVVNINIGMLYMDFDNYQQAAQYFEAALSLLVDEEELPGRESLIFSANIGLANTCLMRHDLMMGRNYMERAKTAGAMEADPVNLLVYQCFRARIHQEEKKFTLRDEAIEEISHLIDREFPLLDIFEDVYRYMEMLLDIKRYEELWPILEKLETVTKQPGFRNLEKRLIALKIKYYKENEDRAGYLQAAGLYFELSDMMEKENSFMIGKMLDIRSILEESTKKQRVMSEQNEKLKARSETDALTGLSNRFRLNQEAETSFQEARKKKEYFAIEILDVDYFKGFNDNYGHQAGDRCIKGVADRIASMQEHENVFAARYGGDEFVLIYRGYDKSQVEEMMRELRGKIIGMAMKHEYSKAASVVTISQGGCIGIPKEGQEVASYLHTADDMLYEIKTVSRNNYKICEYGT